MCANSYSHQAYQTLAKLELSEKEAAEEHARLQAAATALMDSNETQEQIPLLQGTSCLMLKA